MPNPTQPMNEEKLREKVYDVTQYLVNTSNRDGKNGKHASYNDARGAAKEIVNLILADRDVAIVEARTDELHRVNGAGYVSGGYMMKRLDELQSQPNAKEEE